MIEVPLGVGWFILIVDVVVVSLCVLAAWASHSHERKTIIARELEITVREGILKELAGIAGERDRMLWHRQVAITELEERHGSVAERERAVEEREFQVGQAVHDTCTLVNATMHQVADDTVFMELDWKEVADG